MLLCVLGGLRETGDRSGFSVNRVDDLRPRPRLLGPRRAPSPSSAGQPLVIPESPASPPDDVVPVTPPSLSNPPVVTKDPVLARMVRVNAEGLRKPRLDLGLSPDLPSRKHRLLNAKLDISTLFE
jgi:hypothetical protein